MVFLVWATQAIAQNPEKPKERAQDAELFQAVPTDSIPPITNPVFVSRAEAESRMSEDEPVLGLVDPATGQAKAYSLWLLDRHEIVNDRMGGKPIAVTW